MKKIKKYRLKRILKISIFIVLILIILLATIYTWTKKIEPTIISLADSKTRSAGLLITNQVVNEYFNENKIDNMIEIVRNSEDKIISLKTDTLKLNKMSSEISLKIQERLGSMGKQKVTINLGTLTGNKLLYAVGPKFHINISPFGNVSVKFYSTFKDSGINQTLHKVNLKVITKVIVIAPFISKYQEYDYDINVSETVIIGDVPETYYSISGISDLDGKDVLNLTQ